MTSTLAMACPSSERPAGSLNVGFLSVLHEATGYLGGYLVTNVWGRPLEFRLSSAVQPNRVQQILYAGTLQSYVCADLIGKTLVEKSATPVEVVVTDCRPVLELRWRLDLPVIWLAPADVPPEAAGAVVRRGTEENSPLRCHPAFPRDAIAVRALLDRLDPSFDLAEPFLRVREAIGEARKMGVAGR